MPFPYARVPDEVLRNAHRPRVVSGSATAVIVVTPVGRVPAAARTHSRAVAFVAAFAALAAGPVVAQQPAATPPVARISGVQGNVLVSDADGMSAAANGQKLAPGMRIITTGGAKATISYDRGCVVDLGENRRYTVREQAECATAKSPPLGAASSFAVLGAARVVNAGGSVIRGDLGVSPGTAVSGFPQGKVVDGAIQTAGILATQAQRDVALASADLTAQPCNLRLVGKDLGGQTLTPGVYCFPSAPARLTGELVLDAQGDPDAVFVFQVGTTLTTAAGSAVRVVNSGQQAEGTGSTAAAPGQRRATLCNVYWLVGDAATLGSASAFIGTIIAQSGISAGTEASVHGRALARSGAVTLDSNAVELPICFVPFAIGPGTLGAIGVAIGAGVGIGEINRSSNSPN